MFQPNQTGNRYPVRPSYQDYETCLAELQSFISTSIGAQRLGFGMGYKSLNRLPQIKDYRVYITTGALGVTAEQSFGANIEVQL